MITERAECVPSEERNQQMASDREDSRERKPSRRDGSDKLSSVLDNQKAAAANQDRWFHDKYDVDEEYRNKEAQGRRSSGHHRASFSGSSNQGRNAYRGGAKRMGGADSDRW